MGLHDFITNPFSLRRGEDINVTAIVRCASYARQLDFAS